MTYEPRIYRAKMQSERSVAFVVVEKETDLHIQICPKDSAADLAELKKQTRLLVLKLRSELAQYIAEHPEYATSLEPLDISEDAPAIVKMMAEAAKPWNVGPMAAVAGAFSKLVGEFLAEHARTVIVENGGDIFLKSDVPLKIGLYAGEHSPFTDKVKFELPAAPDGLGICTSSGTVGHSLSFGKADAVVIVSRDVPEADAAATSIANRVQSAGDINPLLAEIKPLVLGAVIAIDKQIGFVGNIQLTT